MSRRVKSGKVNLNFVVTGDVKVDGFQRQFSIPSHHQNKTKKQCWTVGAIFTFGPEKLQAWAVDEAVE